MRLPALAGLLYLLLAWPCEACCMMPAGPSPDPSFVGLWRIVEARPAPWANAPLSAAPLLEYAVDFADRQVKGPAPLACKDARYSNGTTAPKEAFGGRMTTAEAQKLGFSDLQWTTFRVLCGVASRDLYLDTQSDLVMADGDVLYTLERPEGDPNSIAPGFSGPSFDCLKAKSAFERLVCRDSALAKSDREIARVYVALKARETPASFETVRAAQKAWLSHAAKSCGAEGAMPESYGDRRTMTTCLSGEYDERTSQFEGLKVYAVGAMRLEPRMRFAARSTPSATESDTIPWVSGGGNSFNTFMTSLLEPNRWRTDDTSLFLTDVEGVTLIARRGYRVTRFDRRIVSIEIVTRDYTGGNQDVRSAKGHTYDLARARPVTLADVFLPRANWKSAVTAYCAKDLARQYAEDNATPPETVEVASTVAAEGAWLWTKDGAEMIYIADTVGGLAGREYDIDIPFKVLAPYMKADAPVR